MFGKQRREMYCTNDPVKYSRYPLLPRLESFYSGRSQEFRLWVIYGHLKKRSKHGQSLLNLLVKSKFSVINGFWDIVQP